MAFDGAFLHTVLDELNTAVLSRVEKIYQPAKDEIVLHLKKKDFSKKLHIVVRSGSARMSFTNSQFENPSSPPMFCMLLRKIFSSARFISAEQKGLERVAELNFQTINEMGDTINPKIICEFIGGSNNIILVDDKYKIFDALSRSDITADRLIMPGCEYEYPKSRGKLNILNCNIEDVLSKISENNGEVSSALLDIVDGFSPLVCREMCFTAFSTVDAEIGKVDIDLLKTPLENCVCAMRDNPDYTVLYDNGIPKDFSFIDINQYGGIYEKKHFSSATEMLNEFYLERDITARLKRQSGDVLKVVNNLLSRANRRMNLRIKDLEATKNREDLRVCGELIKANIHLIKPGDAFCEVQNFYDENLSKIKIKLDPALSPSLNAAKYFKDYKKSCAAFSGLGALIESDKREIEYLDSVLESLERAKTSADIEGIRDELLVSGYIKGKKTSKKSPATTKIEEHLSTEGYKIFVGHNNLQNDYITTRLADKTDMWFHTKNIHGSHVLVKNKGGDLSEQTIIFAAKLAAGNSRAKNSSNVPVDYTPVKYVKKPAGAKAGMVIYTTNKTVFVTPMED